MNTTVLRGGALAPLPGPVPFSSVRWTDPAQYSVGHDLPGTLAVLSPASESRRDDWERVLCWYFSNTEPAPRLCPSPGGAVVAVDEEFGPAAQYYAEHLGAPLFPYSSLGSLVECPPATDHLALFVPPRLLGCNAVSTLRQGLPMPFSIVTARDLAGCSFLVAKMLLGPLTSSTTLWIDVESRSSGWVTPHGVEAIRFDPESNVQALSERNLRTLVLLAHGEGAHANLHGVVLCGHLETDETLMDGRIVSGCDGRRCKRAHRPGLRVVGWRELRCSSLVLFSCNGFSVAGEHYPSGVSTVLSAVDGYVRELLLPDRPLPYDDFEAAVFASALAQGLTLQQISSLRNEVCGYQIGAQPWLVVGVDARSSAAPRLLPSLRSAPVDPDAVVELDGCPARLCFRSHGRVSTFDRAVQGALRAVDCSPELQQTEAVLAELGARVAHAEHLEHAVRLFHGRGQRGSEVVDRLEELSASRDQLGGSVSLLNHLVARSRLLGLWERKSVSLIRKKARQAIESWDAALTGLIHEVLLDGSRGIYHFTSFGLSIVDRRVSKCDRCRSVTRVETGVLASAPALPVTTENCPVCGFSAVWPASSGRPTLSLPLELEPAGTALLRVSRPLAPSSSAATALDLPLHLVLYGEDKGNGTVFLRRRFLLPADYEAFGATGGDLLLEEVRLPEDLSADLHLFYALIVQGMALSIVCARRPGIPLTSSRPLDTFM